MQKLSNSYKLQKKLNKRLKNVNRKIGSKIDKKYSSLLRSVNISLAAIGSIFLADEHLKELSESRMLPGMDHQDDSSAQLITFKNSHNEGAMLSVGSKTPALTKAISIIFAIAVTAIFLLTLGTKGKYLLKAGLVALLGGAYSNTYDRIKRGYVVDYISINKGNNFMKNVVYNLGDFAIMIGALFVVIGCN